MSDLTVLKKWAKDKAAGPYDYGAGQQVLALIAENEALQKDADRYQYYKRASDFDREKLSALDGEDADSYVDAAMVRARTHHASWDFVHEPPPTCVSCGIQMFTGLVPSKFCKGCQLD